MASGRLFFDDLSESEDDSQQGSSSERGVDPNFEMAISTGRGSKANEPLLFVDEPVMATVEPIVASWPGRSFLKVNSSSCF